MTNQRATAGPESWAVERHDQDDGSISYEIWDHSPERYGRIVTVNDQYDSANARVIAKKIASLPDLVEALKQIAAFNDEGANYHLEQTGSYGAFDEPGSVEIARAALRKAGVVK